MRAISAMSKQYILDHKTAIKFCLDVIFWTLATVTAYALRLEGNIGGFENQIYVVTGLMLFAKTAVVYISRSYLQSWRNASFADLFAIIKMSLFVGGPFFAIALVARTSSVIIPLTVPVLEVILAILFLGGLRASARYILKYHIPVRSAAYKRKRVLIAGAGESGTMVAREMLKHPHENLAPVAFVDDDESKRGQSYMGIPIVGDISKLKAVVRKFHIDELLIAMPSESGDVIRRIVEEAREAGVEYRIIPAIYDLLSGKVDINQIRTVDVQDLLRRKPVQLDTEPIKSYIKGKTVLVTGAGGSIGSEIVRQISRFQPKKIILLGRGENSLHTLVREINDKIPHLDYCIRVTDVRDYSSLQLVFEKDAPEVVFHAAAHKHVPMMEANPAQAILNNVIGTRNLVNLALDYGISHFVNISTDKAVNPTSVMGASKRIAEMIVEFGASQVKNGEVFVSVRFGNVLGSRGSVIPIFREQIKNGGPITITHPDMIRYFMTIPEASQLVLQAGAFNQNGAVYVLDMGEPVRIEQMARDLIRLSGFEPDKDIKIEYSGIRPGEKLYEELLTSEEGTDMTHHKKIFMARKTKSLKTLSFLLDRLHKTAIQGDPDAIREEIHAIVPSYSGCKKQVIED